MIRLNLSVRKIKRYVKKGTALSLRFPRLFKLKVLYSPIILDYIIIDVGIVSEDMKDTFTKDVVYLLIAFMFGVVIFSALYVFIKHFTGPSSLYKGMETGKIWSSGVTAQMPDEDELVLRLDKIQGFRDLKLIYRGLDDAGYLLIDLFILELDPDTGYTYRIHPEDAEKRFELDKYAFKVNSVRKSKLKLERLPD
jgi:hypothetical protein